VRRRDEYSVVGFSREPPGLVLVKVTTGDMTASLTIPRFEMTSQSG
jgi:hypothetical protein